MRAPVRTADDAQLFEMLSGVERPGRYIGGEWNEIVKDHREVALTFALAAPCGGERLTRDARRREGASLSEDK